MQPGYAYYGHHKCGSLWIIGVLENICRVAGIATAIQDHAIRFPDTGESPPAAPAETFLICWNTDYLYVRGLTCRGFHVIRDPRDVIVSGYFSHLASHKETKEWPRLRAYRSYLQTLNEFDGLMAELEFSSVYLYHMLSWDYANPAILECRFETLIAEPARQFAAILGHLGLMPDRVDAPALGRILDALSFERLSGRKPGEENIRSHFRKGVAGDWKDHFTAAHIARFKRLYNPLLLKTGYETREDW